MFLMSPASVARRRFVRRIRRLRATPVLIPLTILILNVLLMASRVRFLLAVVRLLITRLVVTVTMVNVFSYVVGST